MNQNRATNWSTTNKSVNMTCSTYGRTCQISSGPRSSARTGEVWMIFPVTTATTAIQNTHFSSRDSRNLDQSEIRRWVTRSMPPNTSQVQNLW